MVPTGEYEGYANSLRAPRGTLPGQATTGLTAEQFDELPDEIEGRVGVVDGALCPCWSWADAPELYSGKHKTTGHAHQFVCDLFENLMHISDPLPGNTYDAKAIDETGLNELLGDDNAIGDKGYIGTGITTPFRKPAGGELVQWQKGSIPHRLP